MTATVVFAYLGQEVTATVFGGATIVTLVTLFIKGKKPRAKESEKENVTGVSQGQHQNES